MRLSLNGGASWRKSTGAKTLEGVRALFAYQTLIAQRLTPRDHRQNEGSYTTPAPSWNA